jgi:pentatricopeptide repeat protein
MEDVWTMFTKMPSQNVVTWNAILGGCTMHGLGNEALKHFEQMCEEGVQPNDTTFTCVSYQLVTMHVWWMKACIVMCP